eukprot:1456560-Rhodomonas_salina.2
MATREAVNDRVVTVGGRGEIRGSRAQSLRSPACCGWTFPNLRRTHPKDASIGSHCLITTHLLNQPQAGAATPLQGAYKYAVRIHQAHPPRPCEPAGGPCRQRCVRSLHGRSTCHHRHRSARSISQLLRQHHDDDEDEDDDEDDDDDEEDDDGIIMTVMKMHRIDALQHVCAEIAQLASVKRAVGWAETWPRKSSRFPKS